MFLHYFRNSSTFPYLNDFRHQHYNDKLITWTDGSAGKESTCNAGDTGSIPGPGRPPGEGNGFPLQWAWEIPWPQEPGMLQSKGSQKVGHNKVMKRERENLS